MDYKQLITTINEKQIKTFKNLVDFRGIKQSSLPTKRRGMYWIWSNLTLDELAKIDKSTKIKIKPNTKEVPIKELVSRRRNLKNSCKVNYNGYTVVYNGIGGYKKEPPAAGLRKRINQEINCSSNRTGTLNLENRFDDFNTIENWAVSFFDFDDEENKEILKKSPIEGTNFYLDHAKNLEIDWRVEFGTPILTRH